MAGVAILALAVVVLLALLGAAPPTSTSTTAAPGVVAGAPTPNSPAPRRPQGFVLPAECQYVDDGTVAGSATTWKIACPQGLPSNDLRPSLEAQGWSSCGTKVWQKSGVQIAVIDAVNVSGFAGWLDERPQGGSACVQPTPPGNSGSSAP